jgi:hypothetical protein
LIAALIVIGRAFAALCQADVIVTRPAKTKDDQLPELAAIDLQ